MIKPNGRICLSDICLKKELPKEIGSDITSIVNCIGGAILKDEYEDALKKAGFNSIQMIDKNIDFAVWQQSWGSLVADSDEEKNDKDPKGCCSPSVNSQSSNQACCAETNTELKDIDLNEYIASYYVFGVK